MAFSIVPSQSVSHLFGILLNQFGGKLKRHALVGASAFGFLLGNIAKQK
jgi:hypothetical protein